MFITLYSESQILARNRAGVFIMGGVFGMKGTVHIILVQLVFVSDCKVLFLPVKDHFHLM